MARGDSIVTTFPSVKPRPEQARDPPWLVEAAKKVQDARRYYKYKYLVPPGPMTGATFIRSENFRDTTLDTHER